MDVDNGAEFENLVCFSKLYVVSNIEMSIPTISYDI